MAVWEYKIQHPSNTFLMHIVARMKISMDESQSDNNVKADLDRFETDIDRFQINYMPAIAGSHKLFLNYYNTTNLIN